MVLLAFFMALVMSNWQRLGPFLEEPPILLLFKGAHNMAIYHHSHSLGTLR